jgi:arylsulfatase A-like enzyme
MLPGAAPKNHPIAFYALTGLAFFLWENLINGLMGFYHPEVRKTLGGIILYVVIFLALGGVAELLAWLSRRLFPKSAWFRQRYIYLLAVLMILIWKDFSIVLLPEFLHLDSRFLKELIFVFFWILPILLAAVLAGLLLVRLERKGRRLDPLYTTGFYFAVILYLIISEKTTHAFPSHSPQWLGNPFFQPLYLLACMGILWIISRLTKTPKAFNTTFIVVPVILTIAVAVFSRNDSLSTQAIASPQPSSQQSPNVIIMLFDSMRGDHVGAAGSRYALTPFIDSLAQHGRAYQDCYSTASWTLPSVASILTSKLPDELGMVYAGVLPDTVTKLPQIFSRNGYRTACITANIGWISESRGFKKPFNEYYSLTGYGNELIFLPLVGYFGFRRWAQEIMYQLGLIATSEIISWPVVSRQAISFMERNRSEPLFMYLHYFEPHFPYYFRTFHDGVINLKSIKLAYKQYKDYELSAPGRGASNNSSHDPSSSPEHDQAMIDLFHDRYCEGVQLADQAVKNMISILTQLGLEKNTILIITGDHGDEFLEHNMWGHSQSIYNELVHTPLVIYIPPELGISLPDQPAGVSTMDIGPTALDLAGIKETIPGGGGWSLMRPYPEAQRPRISMVNVGDVMWRSVVMKPDKLIIRRNVVSNEADTLLFNLDADPGERHNLFAQNRPLADSLSIYLKKHWEVQAKSKLPARMSARELERLKALGYVH